MGWREKGVGTGSALWKSGSEPLTEEERAMKRILGVTLAVAVVVVLAGAAVAFMGGGAGTPMAGGMAGMGPGMMGGGMMGGTTGQTDCPGMTAVGTTTTATPITEEKARELATQYTEKYLKGFAVERLLPFTGMHMTMYQAELKGPAGETRTLHINPWGNVMPFGGTVTR
jgi:hypothetical protein